jgi:hypothetical protein
MADDKVMNQYYPSDFDPSKMLPIKAIRPKRSAGLKQMSIRMMLPFTMRCDSCGQFLFIATKFNSRCEKIPGKTALGLNAYRFYGSCKHCKGEFTFRTDPEKSDYILESGGTRSYEAFKDADLAEEELAKSKAEAEAADEGEKLENKIYDTAEEMRRIEELGELRSLNKREARRNEAIHLAIERVTKAAFEEDGIALNDDEEREAEEEFNRLKQQRVDSNVPQSSAESKPASQVSVKSQSTGLKLQSLGIKIKPKNSSNS